MSEKVEFVSTHYNLSRKEFFLKQESDSVDNRKIINIIDVTGFINI
jgi:hypothetical protein